MPQGEEKDGDVCMDSVTDTIRKSELTQWGMNFEGYSGSNVDDGATLLGLDKEEQLSSLTSPFGELESNFSVLEREESLPQASMTQSVWEKRFSKAKGKALPSVLFDQTQILDEEKNRKLTFTEEEDWEDSEGEENVENVASNDNRKNSSENYESNNNDKSNNNGRNINSGSSSSKPKKPKKGFFQFFCCGNADIVVDPIEAPVS